MNLYSFFASRFAGSMDRAFVLEARTGRELLYRDVEALSSRLAWQLTRTFGVKRGDRVAVQVEKSPEAFCLYLACLRAGAVYLPLNSAYQPAEIAYFVEDAEPKLFVCDPAKQEVLKTACPQGEIQWATLNENGAGSLFEEAERLLTQAFKTEEVDDDDLAAILYTSGTTGRSKGAMLSHRNLRTNADALTEAWGFTAKDRLLHSLPIFHVHGLFISLHCVLSSGASAIWLPKFDAQEVMQYLPKATVFMGVPTYYTRLLSRKDFDRSQTQQIRLFVSGSAPLLPATFEEFEARTGQRILERYGMTETGIITSNPLKGNRIAGTVGRALNGVEVRIDGNPGMIEVRGPNVFKGYWKRQEKTREEFTEDGFFKTGDLGSLDESGYVTISGRAKDLVISGGFNVYPKEIELLLDSIDGVAESAVFGVPHPDFGEAVVAAVIRRSDIHEEALIAQTREKLASFKMPKRIFFLDSLPRNAMGKVQKKILRERFADTFTS